MLDRIDLAQQIFAQGYLSVLETILEKAVKLLMLESSQQSSKELYRLVIEQSFGNLEDLVHFLEADGSELKELTSSALVQKSFMLVSQPHFQQAIQSVKIMTKISSFFRELSEDNASVGALLQPAVVDFVHSLEPIVAADNCEFVINMAIFFFNCIATAKGVAGVVEPAALHCILSIVDKTMGLNALLPQM